MYNGGVLTWILIITAWIALVLFICRFLGINTDQEREILEKLKKDNEK